MMDIALMIYYCRSIARLKGELKPVYCWPCSPWPSPVAYEDAYVKIMADFKSPALYVEMMLPHQNPVICIDQEGKLYRTHGERHMIEDHIKKLAILEKPTTHQETVQFLCHWGDWFYNHTESFEGALGRSLAYLCIAIAKDNKVELGPTTALVQLLKNNGIKDDDPIWKYIDVVRIA